MSNRHDTCSKLAFLSKFAMYLDCDRYKPGLSRKDSMPRK